LDLNRVEFMNNMIKNSDWIRVLLPWLSQLNWAEKGITQLGQDPRKNRAIVIAYCQGHGGMVGTSASDRQ